MGLYRRLQARTLLGAVAAAALAVCAPAAAGEATEQFFRGLRERRLFSIAEAWCLEQLSRETSPERRAEFAIELSRTFVEHAKFTGGREHDELWERAAQAVDELLTAAPEAPRRTFLEAQRACVAAARGEFFRRQSETSPHDEALRTEALATLGDALERLRRLEAPLSRRYEAALQSSRQSSREPLSGWELKTLLRQVQYELGAALVGQADLHAAGSAERAAALAAAEEPLRTVADGPTDEDITLMARVRLAEVFRLTGEARRAATQLADVEKSGPPLPVLNAAVAERVRLMLQEGSPDDAAELLSRYRQLYRHLPGELWFLDVQSLLGMWRIAVDNDDELATDLMERIGESVARSEHEAGGHWAYRCRLLLDQARQSSRYGPELADLMRRAQAAYANGRLDDAIAAYAEAAQKALQTSRPEAAFDLSYTRASVQLHSGRLEDAEAEFRRLALEYPAHEQAPAAHLLAAWCLGRIYDVKRTESARLAFVDALTRHRQQYHSHATAYDAVWMLAALEERRLQATAALKLYSGIPPDHARGAEAQVAVARCYETILERLREHVRPADDSRRDLLRQRLRQWESDAISHLEEITAAFPSERAALSRPQAEVALRLARIRLNTPHPDYAAADRLLARIFDVAGSLLADTGEDSTGSPAAQWSPILNAATQLRIVSLAGQGKVADAERFLQGLSGTSPAEALGVLDGLSQIAADADDAIRQDVGELQLDAAEQLGRRRDELTADQRRRLDNCMAQAYVATRQPKRAIAVYESLLAAAPRDRRLLATVARLLMDECGTSECLHASKQHWRALEGFDPPGSAPWFQARLNVARTSFALREYDECRKLLGVTRLLYPALGGDELREQFHELERRLDAVASRR